MQAHGVGLGMGSRVLVRMPLTLGLSKLDISRVAGLSAQGLALCRAVS